MNFSWIYVTAKDEDEARKIAQALLEKHLIACANMFSVKSLYWWKGAIEDESEVAMIMKTRNEHKDKIISEIKAIHSYEIPCIEFLSIEDGNPDFLRWIGEETKGA